MWNDDRKKTSRIETGQNNPLPASSPLSPLSEITAEAEKETHHKNFKENRREQDKGRWNPRHQQKDVMGEITGLQHLSKGPANSSLIVFPYPFIPELSSSDQLSTKNVTPAHSKSILFLLNLIINSCFMRRENNEWSWLVYDIVTAITSAEAFLKNAAISTFSDLFN